MNQTVAILLQISLILVVARLFSEILKRLNQPPVLGELLAGIVLGPSVFGALFPSAQNAIFENRDALGHLSLIGLILLMLLTGLETDIRVIRTMGYSAFTCSMFGMLIPFGSGVALAMTLNDHHIASGTRLTLTLFLATAMAISAMPVIAKILLDMKLVKRNVGLMTLSAALVDDTIGWIVLAIISGLVTHGAFDGKTLTLTLGALVAFLLIARYVVFPGLRKILPYAEHSWKHEHGQLGVVLVVTAVMAAMTEAIHIHAVFGAFIAGVILRQCTALRSENIERIEVLTMALFAPLFFGAVGLKVDLTKLTGWMLPVVIILVAISGKVIGCYIGGVVGGLPKWEALGVGFCMSARGAMELVVASIGLQLGVINTEMYSSIVLMALVTSFLAPVMMKMIIHKLPFTEAERLRIQGAPSGGFMPQGKLRVLLPVGGGENAVTGAHLAANLCRADAAECTALHVERNPLPWWKSLFANRTSLDTKTYFERINMAAGAFKSRVTLRQLPLQGSIIDTILVEAAKDYDFLVIGASGNQHPVYDPFISETVSRSPCHVVVVAGAKRGGSTLPFQRILIPSNGSFYSDAAFDWAAQYAEAVGARLTVLYVSETQQHNPLLPMTEHSAVGEHMQDVMRITLKQQFSDRTSDPKRLECLVRESNSVLNGFVQEVQNGDYDLVVLGAENKSIVDRLYLGQHVEAAITEVPCAMALVIPKITATQNRRPGTH